MDMSSDASVVAAGFSSAAVRLWMLDPQRGFNDEALAAEALMPADSAATPSVATPWTDTLPAAAAAAAAAAASAGDGKKKCGSVPAACPSV
jgi:hypothetical protein